VGCCLPRRKVKNSSNEGGSSGAGARSWGGFYGAAGATDLVLLLLFIFETLVFPAQKFIELRYQVTEDVAILFGRDPLTQRRHLLSFFGGHLSPPTFLD